MVRGQTSIKPKSKTQHWVRANLQHGRGASGCYQKRQDAEKCVKRNESTHTILEVQTNDRSAPTVGGNVSGGGTSSGGVTASVRASAPRPPSAPSLPYSGPPAGIGDIFAAGRPKLRSVSGTPAPGKAGTSFHLTYIFNISACSSSSKTPACCTSAPSFVSTPACTSASPTPSFIKCSCASTATGCKTCQASATSSSSC